MTQHLIIGGDLPSANESHEQRHWSARKRRVTAWHTKVKVLAREQRIAAVDRYPVEIEVRAFFPSGAVRYDAGNLATIEKLTTDALVRTCGVLEGDSPKYVRRVILGPCERDSKAKHPYVIYTIHAS